MDREQIEYFERKFGRIDEKFGRIDEKFGRIDEKFGRIDEKFGRIDEKFGRIDEKFGNIERKLETMESGLEGFREETEKRFDQFGGQIRRSHVLTENLRSDLNGVAEGVVATREQLTLHRKESEEARQEDKALLISLFRHGQRLLETHEKRLDEDDGRLTRLESARA